MDSAKIKEFELRVRKELYENIVPFWSGRCIDENGGFIGRMTNDGTVDKKAPKGLVLNTRILWTFSALYAFDKKPEHLVWAKRAYDYLMEHFWDNQNGGMFWMLDWEGKPLEDKKQIYGQGFAIYALSEYYRASGSKDVLDKAKAIFDLLEKYVWDKKYKGYFESFDRDWSMSKGQQLTSGDMAAAKSMNTSLHALEGIANLYDVCKDPLVGQRVEDMLEIYADYIAHPYGTYSQLFFNEMWYPKSEKVSFGHDIEASWLVYRDAEILNKPRLVEKIRRMGLKLAEAVYDNGLDNKKSMFYEADNNGVSNSEKHWWVQAEAVVGYLNAYQLTGRQEYLEVAYNIWGFIEDYIVDKKGGEWFWKVDAKGKVDKASLKVSEWKCPYHNSRACIEIIQRLQKIQKKSV
jgi:mannobiose 2-epimerase